MKNLNQTTILIILCIAYLSGNTEIYSQQNHETIRISENTKNFLELKLLRANESGNTISICNVLLRMGNDPEKVYSILSDSVDVNRKVCLDVLVNNEKHASRNYSDALIRLFPNYWATICQKCKTKIDFKELEIKKDVDKRIYNKFQRINGIDPNLMDLVLIKTLDTILFDDQLFRNSINPYNPETDCNQQNLLDSINYQKSIKILHEHGYPDSGQTGLKHKTTIWLVLHHQGSIERRIDNRNYIIEGLENGSLSQINIKLYDDRTKRYINEQKN